jgi:hypothetical protein
MTGGGGRSHQGKIIVVGAVEIEDGGPGHIRFATAARLLGSLPPSLPGISR